METLARMTTSLMLTSKRLSKLYYMLESVDQKLTLSLIFSFFSITLMLGTRSKGLGMARPERIHQMICKKLLVGLNQRIGEKNKRFCANLLYEDSIRTKGTDEKDREIVPDISLYNKYYEEKKKPRLDDLLFLIEVSRGKKCVRTERNIKDMFSREPTLQEAFLYYYEIDKWFRYTRVKGAKVPYSIEQTDYSEVFGVSLQKYLLFENLPSQKEECWTELKE